jgi:LacI family transcriptional regulator
VHPFHDYDNEAFAYEALRILQKRGRKRVALLGPPRDLTYSTHTHRGFERGLRDFGLEPYHLGSADIDQPLEATRRMAHELTKSRKPADAYVCSGVSAAFALTKGLEEAGHVVARDFDIVSKHSSMLLAFAQPKIISIPEDFRKAGYRLAQLLMRSIEGDAVTSLQEVIGIEATDV